ncbi:MAG: apolipoprotein N-acyltransferase [Candidatus Latescibacterota bacterium]|jgi:apolipoprotein N-acyltransferase
MSKRFWWVFAVSGGLLLGLSFPPLPFPWLAWMALLPLLWVIKHCDWRQSAVAAFVAHVIAYLAAGYWVMLHPDPYTRWASAAGIVWLAVLSTIPWTVAARARTRIRRLLWLFAGIGSVEMFQLYSDLGFPWLLLGHTQAAFEPFNQLAELGGVTGLSMWIVGINIAIWSVIDRWHQTKWIVVAVLVLLIAIPAVTGSVRLEQTNSEVDEANEVKVVGIQPALAVRSWRVAEDASRVDSLQVITDRLLEAAGLRPSEVNLIIWPETTIPPTNLSDAAGRQFVRDLQRSWHTSLLSGAIELVPSSNGSPFRNAVVFIRGDSTVISLYRKRRLVPFAEHVPYSDLFPVLRRLAVPAGGVWGYEAGNHPGLFTLGDKTKIGTMICFESVFGYLSRELSRAGASLLVVVTQDGWWGDSFGYRQHVAFTRLRAIETGLPIVQVAATGVSARINRRGHIEGALDWMERGALVATVRPHRVETLYIELGDWPGELSVILALFLILSARFTKSRTE